MQTEPLTREDVIRELGQVDEEMIADLISIQATPAQLHLAVEQLRSESFGWQSTLPRSDLVIALRQVLQPWWQGDGGPEYLGTD